jgi:two-component system OmpR family sensor kinase
MRSVDALRGSSAWQGLRGRLLGGTLALLAAGLLITDISAYVALQTFLRNRVDVTLESLAARIQRQPAGGAGASISWDTVRVLAPSTQYVAVVAGDGRILVAHAAVSGDEDLTPPVLPNPVTASVGPFTVASAGAGPGYRMSVIALAGGLTLKVDDIQVKPTAVIVGVSLADTNATLRRLLTVEILASAGIMVLGVLTSLVVLDVGLRPLRTMADIARAIAGGQRGRRIPVPHPKSEIGRVAGELNAAFDEREAAEERVRRFVADASHELRTPLTTIRGWGDLYLNGGVTDWVQADVAMERIADEAGRMQRLVEDLILMARLDARRPLERRPTDLGALLDGLVADLRTVDQDRSITLRVTAPDPVVEGDETALLQVLRNLLGNALRHTPAGSPIEVTVAAGPGRTLEVTVRDHGPGLDPTAISHAFERFWRADDGRSANGGSGLGLSIAREITEAHSGTLTLHDRRDDGGGLEARFTLPTHDGGRQADQGGEARTV